MEKWHYVKYTCLCGSIYVLQDKKITFAADDILITTVFINPVDETVIADANKLVQSDIVSSWRSKTLVIYAFAQRFYVLTWKMVNLNNDKCTQTWVF